MPISSDVVSHWHVSTEAFNTSALEFYASIEESVAERMLPVSRSRTDWNEGGLLSAKRVYLRLSYGRYIFDISAFPFGTDFYFSWWLIRKRASFAALFGCLGILGLPTLWLVCISAFGPFKGTLLALLLIAVGGIIVAQTIQENSSEIADTLIAIPYLGPLLERLFSPSTYYSADSRIMFEETVHRIVIHEVETLLAGKGARALSPEQLKPEFRRPL